MKKTLLISLSLLPLSLIAQQKYSISGRIVGLKVEKMYLEYSRGIVNEPMVLDSAEVISGKYSFSGHIENITFARLRAKDASKGTAVMILAPEKTEIIHNGELGKITITGSRANDDFKYMNAKEASYRIKEQLLSTQEAKDLLFKEKQERIYGDYVRSNPKSPLALYALKRYGIDGHEVDAKKIEPLFKQLPSSVQKSPEGRELMKKIEYTKVFTTNSSIGRNAQDFALQDTAGKIVKLSDFKGKYVLLDFWASWCSPCRADNPHLKTAYDKYHGQGFDILSVSLDLAVAEKKWRKAIHDDGIGGWTHVADLNNAVNAAVKLYGVQGIPQNFLIGPDGKIIAASLRQGALETKLGEIFKN